MPKSSFKGTTNEAISGSIPQPEKNRDRTVAQNIEAWKESHVKMSLRKRPICLSMALEEFTGSDSLKSFLHSREFLVPCRVDYEASQQHIFFFIFVVLHQLHFVPLSTAFALS